MALLEESDSTINSFLGSGCARTGAELKVLFNVSKAVSTSGYHFYSTPFLGRVISGATWYENPLIKHLSKLATSMNHWTPLMLCGATHSVMAIN